ncbi:hypothetical protein [Ktedonobacter robiniae]|uniref:Uncharacterized protein n=1 Tax=Ktedonobacter robiniae TaxID=2778365 RepID=A0ABQ3V212_9CHLR|nr:hypothetical protein [Ktedonobacter robiniae]GHO59189.1 hypothetical protein KSB_76640 [Ktedonobacter robiniae]
MTTSQMISPIPETLKAALKEPFPPEQIDFLPKMVRRNKAGALVCRALPYANKRIYEDRLNELAFGLWSTPYVSPFQQGNKLIVPVTVTLCGVPHTDYGESFLMLKNRKGVERENENSATEAYSQGFRRACAQFLLGRYLYTLDALWLPYDGDADRIAVTEGERIAWIEKLYLKAGLPPRPTQHAVSRGAPQETTSVRQILTDHPASQEHQVQPKEPAVSPAQEHKAATMLHPESNKQATKEQRASLEKLRQRLTITTSLPQTLSYDQAAALLKDYSQQYQQRPKATPASRTQTPEHPPRVNTLFVEWIRKTVQQDAERIARICKHYQIARLEDLTHEQSLDLTHRLKQTHQKATQATTRTQPSSFPAVHQ